MSEAEVAHRAPRAGHCVGCREMKPDAHFRKNAAGALTAWCESCRLEKAKKWGIEEDQVELAHALYVLEEAVKADALVHAKAMGHAMEIHLAQGIRVFEANRSLRIPAKVQKLVEESRQAFYTSVNMVAPHHELPLAPVAA